MKKQYIPQVGDLFEWLGASYWCIETGSVSGVVCPKGETFHLRNFHWEYEGVYSNFIRKATPAELESMGLKNEATH